MKPLLAIVGTLTAWASLTPHAVTGANLAGGAGPVPPVRGKPLSS